MPATVLLKEFYAENPRRYILKPEGFSDHGWYATDNATRIICRAYAEPVDATVEQLDEVLAEQPNRRWAWMKQFYREPGWTNSGPRIWLPRNSLGLESITLFEVIADTVEGRRFAYFQDGRAESGWIETGRKYHFFRS